MRVEPKSVSAETVCLPVQKHLETHLAAFLDTDLDRPALWRQLPSENEMDTVRYPAVAVGSPGTIEDLEYTSTQVWAVYRVVVAFWVEEFGYDETTSATRRYVANARDCLLAAGRKDWRVTGEDFSRIVDPRLTKTLGGGRVYLRVKQQIADTRHLTLTPGAPPLPVVTSHTVTVAPKE